MGDSVLKYESEIKSDRFVVVVHGSADELSRAKNILTNMGHELQMHLA